MPSAAKGAVLIMSEKKTSGIKNFFEEFKAFAMRGNVLDMAVGVVVGSAFTAIVNSLVNDIIVWMMIGQLSTCINCFGMSCPILLPEPPAMINA